MCCVTLLQVFHLNNLVISEDFYSLMCYCISSIELNFYLLLTLFCVGFLGFPFEVGEGSGKKLTFCLKPVMIMLKNPKLVRTTGKYLVLDHILYSATTPSSLLASAFFGRNLAFLGKNSAFFKATI